MGRELECGFWFGWGVNIFKGWVGGYFMKHWHNKNDDFRWWRYLLSVIIIISLSVMIDYIIVHIFLSSFNIGPVTETFINGAIIGGLVLFFYYELHLIFGKKFLNL